MGINADDISAMYESSEPEKHGQKSAKNAIISHKLEVKMQDLEIRQIHQETRSDRSFTALGWYIAISTAIAVYALWRAVV